MSQQALDLRKDLLQKGVPLLSLSELEEAPAPFQKDVQPGELLRELPRGTFGVITGSWSSGKTSLALTEVARITRRGGSATVVDGTGWLFPPALSLLGGRLDRILVLTPSVAKAVWATEQVLRSGAFELTVLLEPKRLPRAALRRLQLAAERGDSKGLVVRRDPISASLASLRLRVEPVPVDEHLASHFSTIAAPPRRCRVQLSRKGVGGAPSQRAEVALG